MSDDLPSGLHAHDGYWLDRLRSLVHHGFDAALAAEQVTMAQWSALITLYRGEARTPAELARFIDVDPGALTRLLDRMERKGLVTRMRDDADRRSITLALTDRARALAPKLSGLADANDRLFFGALDAEEQAELRRLIAKLLAGRGIDAPASWSGA